MAMLESGEMYLETIYILSQKMPAVRSIDVSEYMGFSKPSVSRALGILKKGRPCGHRRSGIHKTDGSGREESKRHLRAAHRADRAALKARGG